MCFRFWAPAAGGFDPFFLRVSRGAAGLRVEHSVPCPDTRRPALTAWLADTPPCPVGSRRGPWEQRCPSQLHPPSRPVDIRRSWKSWQIVSVQSAPVNPRCHGRLALCREGTSTAFDKSFPRFYTGIDFLSCGVVLSYRRYQRSNELRELCLLGYLSKLQSPDPGPVLPIHCLTPFQVTRP